MSTVHFSSEAIFNKVRLKKTACGRKGNFKKTGNRGSVTCDSCKNTRSFRGLLRVSTVNKILRMLELC